jgi:hypothetical protein
MIAVIPHAEAFADQLPDARQRPEIGGEAQLRWSLEEPSRELALLTLAQRAGPSGRGPGVERCLTAFRVQLEPLGDGRLAHAEAIGDFLLRGAVAKHGDGTSAPILEILCRAFGSTHEKNIGEIDPLS